MGVSGSPGVRAEPQHSLGAGGLGLVHRNGPLGLELREVTPLHGDWSQVLGRLSSPVHAQTQVL